MLCNSRGIVATVKTSSSNVNLTYEHPLWAKHLNAVKVREPKMDMAFLQSSQCTKFLKFAVSNGNTCYMFVDFDHFIKHVCFRLMCL
jgi:hypothetical protein